MTWVLEVRRLNELSGLQRAARKGGERTLRTTIPLQQTEVGQEGRQAQRTPASQKSLGVEAEAGDSGGYSMAM